MIKQNPFSLYDFLGYLIPGATLIYAYSIVSNLNNSECKFDLNALISSKPSDIFQDISFFVIIAYSLGHLISFVSSIAIEKYGNWKYGYPSKTIIGFVKKSYWVLKKDENSKNDIFIYESESNKSHRLLKNFGRFLLIIFILPLFIFDLFFGQLLKFKNFYSKKMDDQLVNIIIKKVKLLILKIDDNPIEIHELKKFDFNRVAHHYTFENSKEHQFRMVNYVALYGFLRNLVLTFILAFWYYFILSINTLDFGTSLNWNVIGVNLIIMLLSYIAFMAYMKFYRRYTLEGLMLLVISDLKSVKKK